MSAILMQDWSLTRSSRPGYLVPTNKRLTKVAYAKSFHSCGLVLIVTYRNPDTGPEGLGAAACFELVKATNRAFPDKRNTIEGQVAEGDCVVTWGTTRGTQQGAAGETPASGKSIALPWTMITELRGGKIARDREFYDRLGLTQQIGKEVPGGNDEIVKESIRVIERQRLRSLVEADIATAQRLHADEFQLITPSGGVFSKDRYMNEIGSGVLVYRKWEPAPEITVRLYGDVAVLRYQDARFEVFYKGLAAWDGPVWHTDVYEKRSGQWQVVWSHASGGKGN